MSFKKTNNFQIQEDFQQILSNFTKAIIFYKPKDVIDFAIKYFISLEKNTPIEQLLEKDNYINELKTDSTLNNEQKLVEQENVDLDDTNSKDILEVNDIFKPIEKIPLTEGLRNIIEMKEIENKINKHDDIEKNNNSIEEKEKVKEFISELFEK